MADVTSQYLGKDKVPIISQNTESIIKHRCTYAFNTANGYVLLPKMMSSNGRIIIRAAKTIGTTFEIAATLNGTNTNTSHTYFKNVVTAGPIDLSEFFSAAPFAQSLDISQHVSVWAADTVYSIGQFIVKTVAGVNYVYLATTVAGDFKSGVVEPDWSTQIHISDTIVDDQVTWTNVGGETILMSPQIVILSTGAANAGNLVVAYTEYRG